MTTGELGLQSQKAMSNVMELNPFTSQIPERKNYIQGLLNLTNLRSLQRTEPKSAKGSGTPRLRSRKQSVSRKYPRETR